MEMNRVWHEYHAELRGFVAKRVNDPATAEDIVQEVFLRVIEKRDTLRSGEKLRAWLYRIARNAIVDYYRTRRPLEELPDSLAAGAEGEDEEEARGDIGRCLFPMVNRLPASYREAVVLSELEGKSQKEVAALQGLSLSGAKSRIQRGRALVREMILACCRVEFDGRGRAMDYETRDGGVCGGGDCGRPS